MNSFPSFNSDKFPKNDNYKDFHKAVQEFQQHVKSIESYGQLDLEIEGQKNIQKPRASAAAIPIVDEDDVERHLESREQYEVKVLKWRTSISQNFQSNSIWKKICKKAKEKFKSSDSKQFSGWQTRRERWKQHAIFAHYTSDELVKSYTSIKHIHELYKKTAHALTKSQLSQAFITEYQKYLEQVKIWKSNTKQALIYSMLARLEQIAEKEDVTNDDLLFPLYTEVNQLLDIREKKEFCPDIPLKTMTPELFQKFHLAICKYTKKAERAEIAKRVNALVWFHEKGVPFGIKTIVHSEHLFVRPIDKQVKEFSTLYIGPSICDLALCSIHWQKLQKLLLLEVLNKIEYIEEIHKSVCHIVDFYLKQFANVEKSIHKDAKKLQSAWKDTIKEQHDTIFALLGACTSHFFNEIKLINEEKEVSENVYLLSPILCKVNELADSEFSTGKMAHAYRERRSDAFNTFRTIFEKQVLTKKKNPRNYFILLMALVPIQLKEHVHIVQRVMNDSLQQDTMPLLQQVQDALVAIWGKNADKLLKFLIEYLVQTVTNPRSHALNIVKQYDTSLQSSNKGTSTYIVQWVSKQKNRIKEAQNTALQVFLPTEENIIGVHNEVDKIEESIELLRAYALIDRGPLQAVIEHIKKSVTQLREDSSTEIRHKVIICLQDQTLLYQVGILRFKYFKEIPKALLSDKSFFELLFLCPHLQDELRQDVFGYMNLHIEDVIQNIANFADFSFLLVGQKEKIQLAIDKYWLTQLWQYHTVDEGILSVKLQKSESLLSEITLPEFPLTEQYKKEIFDWLNNRLTQHEERVDSALEKVICKFGTKEQKQKFYGLCFEHVFKNSQHSEKASQILLGIRVLGYSDFLEKYGKENSSKVFQCIKGFFKKPILNETLYIILKNNFVVTVNEIQEVDGEDIIDNEGYSTYCLIAEQINEILNEQYNPIFDTINYHKKKRYEEAYNSVKVLESTLPALGSTQLTQADLHARESMKLLIKKIEEWLQEEITNDKEYLVEDVENIIRLFQEKFLNLCIKIRPMELHDWLKPLYTLCQYARAIYMLHKTLAVLATQSVSSSWMSLLVRKDFVYLFDLLPTSSKQLLFNELIKISLIGQSDRERRVWLLLVTILRGQSDDQLRDLKAIQKLAIKDSESMQEDREDAQQDYLLLSEHNWSRLRSLFSQNQGSKENSVQLLQMGSHQVSKEVWDQLFDATGTPLLGKVGNRHIVIPVITNDKKIFYFKFFPDAPGIQWMSCALRELLWGEKKQKTFKIELAKFPAGTGDTSIDYPVLISQEVPGKTLAELWQENPDINLNAQSFSREFLRILIDLEQDGKPENYIAVAMDDGTYQLVSVDGEQAFTSSAVLRSVSTIGTVTTQLLTKTVLFCFSNMQEQISNEIIDEFLNIDPIKFLRIFIQDVYRYNTLLLQLFSHKECMQWWNQKEQRFLVAPLREDLIQSMYTTLCRIQETFQQVKISGRPITHIELLRKVHPLLASYYEPSLEEPLHPSKRFLKVVASEYKVIHNPENEQYRFLTSRSSTQVVQSMFGFIPNAQEAFSSHIIGADRALHYIETIVQQKTVIKRAQEELLSGIDKTWKKITSPLYKEQVLNGIPGVFSHISWQSLPRNIQEFILKTILNELKEKRLTLRALNIAYCTELTNDMLIDIIKMSPELKVLDISYCRQIDESVLRQLPFYCSALRRLKIDGMLITSFSKRWWDIISPPLEFRELRYLSCNESFSLEKVSLHLPQLRVISLKNCKKLTEVSLKCPNFAQANLEGCDLLPKRLIGEKDITIFDTTKVLQDSIEIDFHEIRRDSAHVQQLKEKLTQLKGVTGLIVKNSCTIEGDKKKPGTLRRESEFVLWLLKVYGPGLTYLNVSSCLWVDDNILKEIVTVCPKLERLFCAHTKITDESKNAFYLNNLQLKVLDISNTSSGDMIVSTIVERCLHLENINLNRTAVTDIGLQTLNQHCKNLEEIDLSECHAISNSGIASFLEKRVLDRTFNQIYITDREKINGLILKVFEYREFIKYIKFCIVPEVEDNALYISEIGYKDEVDIQQIHGMLFEEDLRYLKVLDLSNCKSIEQIIYDNETEEIKEIDLIDILKGCLTLEYLNIEGVVIHDKVLERLTHQLSLLKKINLSSCKEITDQGLLALLQNCLQLEDLNLNCTRVNLESLEKFPCQLNSLKKIKLGLCSLLTDQGLVALVQQSPSLEELDIRFTGVNCEMFEKITHQLPLKKINLGVCSKLTDQGLVALLKNCLQLEEIDLPNTYVSCEGLEKIPYQLSLKKVNISYHARITDQGLLALVQKCPYLEELVLWRTKVNCEMLEKITHQLPLKKINLFMCENITNRGFIALLQKFPHLEELDLGVDEIGFLFNRKISCEGLENISHQLSLRKINLSSCRSVTDHGFLALVQKCPYLEELNLSSTEISLEGFEKLPHQLSLRKVDLSSYSKVTNQGFLALVQKCPYLEELNLSSTKISLEGLEKLPQQLSLRKIDLSSYSEVTDRGLLALVQKCPYLEDLDLRSTEINLEGLEKLSHQLKLRKIDLSSCSGVTDRGLLALAQKCPYLEELNLSSTKISCERLEKLLHQLPLRKIDLSSCSEVTDQGFFALMQKCPYLEEFNLSSTKISCERLEKLSHQLPLRKIDLSSCSEVTDQGFFALIQICPYLEELNLSRTKISCEGLEKISYQLPLRKIDLSSCSEVTDQGFFALVQICPYLEELDLSSTKISCEGLEKISYHLLSLKIINLFKCRKISAQALSSLEQKYPSLRIIPVL